jgi:hypothetical protein
MVVQRLNGLLRRGDPDGADIGAVDA